MNWLRNNIYNIQFQFWKKLCAKRSILYFDATGNIVRGRTTDKSVKLYSFVAHDEENKQIVCISEFVSSSHSSSTIEKYLVTIKNHFKTHSTSILNIFPAIIVTDHCWASINAIHAAFNGISIIQYLNWAYDLIVNPFAPGGRPKHIFQTLHYHHLSLPLNMSKMQEKFFPFLLIIYRFIGPIDTSIC